jgi:cysteine-rich repeat protein
MNFVRFRFVVAVLMVIVFVGDISSIPVFAQSGIAEVSIDIETPFPVFGALSVGSDGLQVTWDWDYFSPGFIPANVTQMNVEISTDAINYSNLQSHLPSEFQSNYAGLTTGSYTVRVTVLDGANIEYIVGPVSVGSSGGRRGGGDTGGGIGGDGGDTTDPIVPPVDPPNITLAGLAYPGPTAVVIFTHDGSFQTTVEPDSIGDFSYNTTSLPSGGATFAFSAQDPAGNLSAPVSFFYSVSAGQTVTVDTIYLPPTLTATLLVLPVGDDLMLSGYAYRDGALALGIEGVTSSAVLTQADGDGFWSVSMSTSGLAAGTYNLVAVSTSSDASIVSPDSSVLTFELVDTLPAAPVCGDNVVEVPEACDDGNLDDGDGCSSLCLLEGCGDGVVVVPEQCDDGNVVLGDGCDELCQLEQQLPDTAVDQPNPLVFTDSTVDLTYRVLDEPNGAVSSVQLYYSLNGASYVPYQASFIGGTIQLIGLVDGDYDVYSLARDAAGFLELVPASVDASFTVDAMQDFDVQAYPEKRVPAEGNWGLASTLTLYETGQTTPKYTFDFQTDDQGLVTIDLPDPFDPALYTVLIKGVSHLSKRIEGVDMRVFNDLVLDFTLNGAFYLIAGDVHPSKDDYVNALDISSIVSMLYGGDVNGDLNLDTTVNALDLSVLVGNLYKAGDGI